MLGRLISDNSIVAFEMVHKMRNRRRGKVGHMAVKPDISKAYNRVEWEFLEKIMLRLGFPVQWVNLAMLTMRTASYSVIIDGESCGYINPSRGIKQGDLLSPYVFLLCVEGLLSLLRKATENHHVKGLLSCHGGVRISHHLFADNCLLFCKAKLEEGCPFLKHFLQLKNIFWNCMV